VHVVEVAHGAAQREPGVGFGHADVRVGAVAQHEEIEVAQRVGGGKRFVRSTQPGEYTRDMFVTDRHHDRGARA
jgi:hypothetical protein